MLIKEFEEINKLSRLESIHYAQMIMNRYMFICFAEDIDLLPAQVSTDTISNPILNGNLRHGSIWQRLNELFLDIDEGNEYKKISQYNGGIFKEDLEHLKIRDIVEDQKFFNEVYQDWKFKEYEQDVNDNLGPYGQKVNPIYRNLFTISTFDFSTELDVNILGHIFENSIGDIEEFKEDSKGRRKKDGIFYTPEYITDYICRNTIIPFLSISGKINTIPELMGEYGRSKIEDLDIKVKNIKVVDPACGSGAFLNKAADILMEIHDAIRERLYTKDKLDHLWDPIEQRREILINNIYGVDLNEESVDITKLSLFLKVCRKGLILPNIDKNIKCGNSLIEDPEFTDKPFNWEKEFKEIFKNGGFDIVVGNPPYVDNRGFDKNQLKYFYGNYVFFSKAGTNEFKTRKFNTFVAFIEKINQLSKKGGLSGYIVHKNLLKTTSYKGIRYLMLKNFKIDKIVDWGPDQFADVIAETISVILEKNEVTDNEITIEFFSKNKQIKSNSINQSLYLDSFDYIFNINLKPSEIKLLKKIENNKSKLSEFVIINNGIVTGNDKKFVISEEVDNYKICVTGKNIERYGLSGFKGYLNYDPSKLLRSRSKDIFEAKEKLIMQMINIKFVVYFDNDQLYNLGTTYAITKKSDSTNLKYILTILNSKLMEFYYLKKFTNESTLTNAISTKNIYELPIVGNINQEPFIEKSNQILILKNELRDGLNGFKGWLQREPYNIVKFSKKLNKYYKLSFEEFLTELNKKKVDTKQRKTQELLKTEFEESVTIINPLLQQIKETDNEIDKMVYDLYGLTPEEIKLIEDCTK
jgi:type I restriction-modification system DNA methylase subunit